MINIEENYKFICSNIKKDFIKYSISLIEDWLLFVNFIIQIFKVEENKCKKAEKKYVVNIWYKKIGSMKKKEFHEKCIEISTVYKILFLFIFII